MTLSEKFQRLHHNKEVPRDLEGEIISSYEKLKLIADITDLFVVKFGESNMHLISDLDESIRNRGRGGGNSDQRPDGSNSNNPNPGKSDGKG